MFKKIKRKKLKESKTNKESKEDIKTAERKMDKERKILTKKHKKKVTHINEEKKVTERKHPNKRKREDNTEDNEPLSDVTQSDITPSDITHMTSYQHVVKSGFGIGTKQSKIIQKPLFKTKKKANPRLSQINCINKYFPSVGTANRGQGRRESAILNDLNRGFQLGQDKTTGQKDIYGPRTSSHS